MYQCSGRKQIACSREVIQKTSREETLFIGAFRLRAPNGLRVPPSPSCNLSDPFRGESRGVGASSLSASRAPLHGLAPASAELTCFFELVNLERKTCLPQSALPRSQALAAERGRRNFDKVLAPGVSLGRTQAQSQYHSTTLTRFPWERGLLLPEEETQAKHSVKTKCTAAGAHFTVGCGCGEEGVWGVGRWSTRGQGPGKDSLPKSTGEPLQDFKQRRDLI